MPETSGYWSTLEPYWDRVNIYDGPATFLTSYNALPIVPRVLYAAHFCESEISNGGLHQFFTNDTGVLAPEAVQAFRTLRLDDAAAILEEAMAFFGPEYPRDCDARIERLSAIPGQDRHEWDPFRTLDEKFYQSLGPDHDRLFDALDLYAKGGSLDAG